MYHLKKKKKNQLVELFMEKQDRLEADVEV